MAESRKGPQGFIVVPPGEIIEIPKRCPDLHRQVNIENATPVTIVKIGGCNQRKGVDAFLVGNQGGFDSTVLQALRLLKKKPPIMLFWPICRE